MSRLLSGFLVLAASFLLVPGAQAQIFSVGDVDFGLTETFYADWHRNYRVQIGDETYNYLDLKNRLNLTAGARFWQAGLRLDAAGFLGPGSGASGDDFHRQFISGVSAGGANMDVRLEKVYARYTRGAYGIEAGDVYGCLGKGIAFCVKKVDELSTDTSLRGIKAYYNGRIFGATAIGGLANIVNVGDKIEQFLPDPNDLAGGVELRVNPVYWARLSAHAGFLLDRQELGELSLPGIIASQEFGEDDGLRREMMVTVGPSMRINDILGHGTFMVEYDALVQSWANEDPDEPQDALVGQALYANGTFNWGVVNVLAEMKWYESHLDEGASSVNFMGSKVAGPSGQVDFVYYGVLPPLEDENLLFRNDRPWDVVGGRTRVDVEIPPTKGGIAWVSYAHFVDTDVGPDLTSNYKVQHVMGGWEQRLDDLSISANVSGGYRKEDYHFTKEDMWHVEGDLHLPIYGPHSIEVSARRESYEQPEFGVEYSIMQVVSTYSFAPWLGLSYSFEQSDQPGPNPATRGNFHSAEVIYRFMSGSYAKIFVGSSRGGLKCAGGMCRTFPPFEGVKGEVTLRF
jgi:hypothetical protein